MLNDDRKNSISTAKSAANAYTTWVTASLIEPDNLLAPTAIPQQTIASTSAYSTVVAPSLARQNRTMNDFEFLIARATWIWPIAVPTRARTK